MNCSKIYLKPAGCDSYYRLFIKNITLRKSCYNCKYSNQPHLADITLADYWGAVGTDKFDEKGVSLVLANTERGLSLLKDLGESVILNSLELDKASYVFIPHNEKNGYNLKKREEFFEFYKHKGIKKAIKKFDKTNIKQKIKSFLKIVITIFKFRKFKDVK